MSIKTRFMTVTLTATLLAGTASFAAPERAVRGLDLEGNQSFLWEAFGWVRDMLAGRRGSEPKDRAPETSSTQKDSCADPNGSPLCRK